MSYAAAFTRSARRQAKRVIARSLILAGRVGKARRARRQDLYVLMYHGVLPEVQGRWNGDSIVAAREAGYRCALTAENGFNDASSDPFQLRRIMAGDKGHLSILSARVSGGWDKLRAHRQGTTEA